MHNNYFFIKNISSELGEILPGMQLAECFSQNKDELILIFTHQEKEFVIQAHLTSVFSVLNFPKEYFRAKKNTVNLFNELKNATVESVTQPEGERAFVINFHGYQLLFKLFGNRANIILFEQGTFCKMFKNSLRQDLNLDINSIGRVVDFDLTALPDVRTFIKQYPFLGKETAEYLTELGYDDADSNGRRSILQKVLDTLNQKHFYLINDDGQYHLSFFAHGEVAQEFTSAIEASSALYVHFFKYTWLNRQKQALESKLGQLIKKTEKYIENAYSKLIELEEKASPSQTADIIMANLHAIPPKAESVNLYDFYNDRHVDISLNPDMSPQKFASKLYQKAKNRPVELQSIRDNIAGGESRIQEYKNDLQLAKEAENYKSFNKIKKKYEREDPEKVSTTEGNFKTFEFMGFKILVGRNAANNDVLTQQYAAKNDLWLHARDVSGSHVVIRNKPGKPFPAPVIEKAASVAAFYSKRKTDSLCPVIVTEKKFVRKVKGAPTGAVKVEKEKVIMVEPAGLTHLSFRV
ncbi:NFACT RNA binding domain-containing protein [Cytophagaceae bacterium ABcell3]|nr:NFACT RNA binding domain-containing protein [Cytophagaceae bacterium ABcell3]